MSTPYELAALERECTKLAATTAGRNSQLNKSAFALGGLVGAGELDRAQAEEALFSASQQNSYVAKDGAAPARATIKSGLDAGARQPRVLPNGAAASKRSPTGPHLPAHVPVLPTGTPGARFFASSADDPPKICDELPNRRHVYRRGGQPVRAKSKRASGGFIDLYVVTHPETGEIGWQPKKPEGYLVTPYVGAVDPFTEAMTDITIFCPEGEKDADTLGSQGLPAFTFGGASDIPEGCQEFVRGRDVVVLADNDDPGRRWADKISSLFATAATKVRVVHFTELPEGNDVSDWFERGGTVAALFERVASARLLESGLRGPCDGYYQRRRRSFLDKSRPLPVGFWPSASAGVSLRLISAILAQLAQGCGSPMSRHRKIMWPPLFLHQPVLRWAMFDGLLRELGGVNLPFSGVVS